MKFLIMLFTFFTIAAQAYVVPTYRDLKPSTQAMLERQDFGLPIAATAANIKSAFAGPTSAATVTLSSFLGQPDVARNLVITPGGTTADVAACVITVNGLNYFGKVMSETFTFTAAQSTAVTGNKAFKSVSSVVWPANCEQGGFAASWSIGVGEKIGLKNCLANAGDWFHSQVAGVKEATAATIVNSASAVESNTADFNGTMNGSNRFIAFFVQNFACLP
jgi:hypothetical protein